MRFFEGLKQSIEEGQTLGRVDENGKRIVYWNKFFNVLLGIPLIFYIIVIILSPYTYSIKEHINNFIVMYPFFFIVSLLGSAFGVLQLETYKYIFNYIFNKKNH